MRRKTLIAIILLTLACLMQTGCALIRPAYDDDPGENRAIRLLYYSRALMQASPSTRLALLATAREAYAQHRTPAAAARLALAYGQPGYKGYAPATAWRYAKQALAAGDHGYWGLAASAYLRQFAALHRDNARIRARLDGAAEQIDDIKQQLARTRQALARANRKLHALTRIETKLGP